MAALIFNIADAVVALLNRGVENDLFAREFTAERKRIFDLRAATSTLKVWVGGTALLSDRAARDANQKENTIEIGILQRMPRENLASEIDALVELAEQVGNFLDDNELELEDVRIARVETSPLYDHNRAMKRGLFAGVMRATYQLMRDRQPVELHDLFGLVNGDGFGLVNGDSFALES